MTRWADDPERAAHSLLAGAVEELALSGSVLLADPSAETVAWVRRDTALSVQVWTRRAVALAEAAPEPPAGVFDVAVLRLPKSREESRMAAHLCLGRLAPHGRLIVYGGNDEGVRAYQNALAALGPVETMATRGHGRIVSLKRADVAAPVLGRLADWRDAQADATQAGLWISYPGLFAEGALDAGTALLLGHLPPIAREARILDYGCGPGAISAAIRRREPSARLTLVDNDSVALVAARENVPDATYVLASQMAAVVERGFDLIVSNPPLHVGFRETMSMVTDLITAAPAHLSAQGRLLLVVQQRIALDAALSKVFATVEVLAHDGRYRVWTAHGKALKNKTGPAPHA